MSAHYYIEYKETEEYYKEGEIFSVATIAEATKFTTREAALNKASELPGNTRIVVFTAQSS